MNLSDKILSSPYLVPSLMASSGLSAAYQYLLNKQNPEKTISGALGGFAIPATGLSSMAISNKFLNQIRGLDRYKTLKNILNLAALAGGGLLGKSLADELSQYIEKKSSIWSSIKSHPLEAGGGLALSGILGALLARNIYRDENAWLYGATQGVAMPLGALASASLVSKIPFPNPTHRKFVPTFIAPEGALLTKKLVDYLWGEAKPSIPAKYIDLKTLKGL